jgi:hypothetical protein
MLARFAAVLALSVCSWCAAQSTTTRIAMAPVTGAALATKEIELSHLIGEKLEAEMLAHKAQARYEALTKALRDDRNADKALDQHVLKHNPALAQSDAKIRMLEDHVEELKLQLGTENPRYKSAVVTLERSRAAFTEELTAARAKAR